MASGIFAILDDVAVMPPLAADLVAGLIVGAMLLVMMHLAKATKLASEGRP